MRQPHRQTFLDVTVSFYGSLVGTVLSSSIHLRSCLFRGCIYVCSYVGMYATLDLFVDLIFA